MGENFYQFWPRTVLGSLKSAWRIEKRRYARKQQHPFRIGNDVLNAWLMSLVLWGALIAWLGIGILPYLIIQAVVGFSLLEVVNYMEHYGMLRQKVGVGERQRYERVDPTHSWNSNNIATNVLLYHLQRHSDHHANPTRRYQSLRDFEESPVLPTGYAGMIVLAVVPAVWRRVMDPRVLAHFDGDLSRANLSPRKRDKILAKYPAPGGRPVVARQALEHLRRPPMRGRGARRPLPRLRLHLPGRAGRRARGLRGRYGVGGRAGRLVLPRLRGAREGRLPSIDTMTPAPTTRERIVDAAVAMTTESGWSGVTMGALADRVGVSRQTVYNEVGSKEGLAEAVILRELARFLDVVSARLRRRTRTSWWTRSARRRTASSSSPRTTSCCTPWSPRPTAPTPSCCRC